MFSLPFPLVCCAGAADHLSRYIVPLLREWSAQDAELVSLLETLGSRGDSLLPAVSYLQSWSSDKGSAVGSVVFQARDTMTRLEAFLDATARRKRTATMTETEKEAIVKQMKRHIREIDFMLASLNLAVSVAIASESLKPTLPHDATYAHTAAGPYAAGPALMPEPPRYISPSCLLRASDRLKSVAGGGMSGDICVAYGSFYTQTARHAGSFGAAIKRALDATPEPAPEHPQPTARWLTPMSPVADLHTANTSAAADTDAEWSTNESHFSPSVSAAHASSTTQYGSSVVRADEDGPVAIWSEPMPHRSGGEADSDWSQVSPTIRATPVQPVASSTTPTASVYAGVSSLHPPASASPSPLPNTLSPWRQVYSSACLKLVRNASRNMYELHVTSLSSSSSDGLTRPSSSTLKFDLTAALDFRSTSSAHLDLLEDAAARRRCSGLVDAVFSFEERIANALQARHAFMLHSVDEQTNGNENVATSAAISSGPLSPMAAAVGTVPTDAMRPLEIAYLARLCMYENLHAESSATSRHAPALTLGNATNTPLRHTQASDEELWLLLAGVHIHGHAPEPTAPTTAPTTPTPPPTIAEPAATNTNTTAATAPATPTASETTEAEPDSA